MKKISFNRNLVEGIDYSVISDKEIAEINRNISAEMELIVKDFEKNEARSIRYIYNKKNLL